LFILEKEKGGRSTVSPSENPFVLCQQRMKEREGKREREKEMERERERGGD
jgi:hypothetical protein